MRGIVTRGCPYQRRDRTDRSIAKHQGHDSNGLDIELPSDDRVVGHGHAQSNLKLSFGMKIEAHD